MSQSISELLKKASALAWVISKGLLTEDEKPLDFGTHPFMVAPYNETHPDIVTMKSAQVGWTTLAILRAIIKCIAGLNVVYTVPTKDAVTDFVTPKVNPIFEANKSLKEHLQESSKSIKRVANRTLFFRGAFSEKHAISVTADALMHDELDRSDQKVINIYRSRTQASLTKSRERFSNPSVPNFGIHLLWLTSDQRHWFVKCSHCGWDRYMDDESNDEYYPHYLDTNRRIYACGKCNKEIYDIDRAMGHWVAKYPKRTKTRGYWISQLMCPWIPADELCDILQDVDTTPEYWNNYVLGKPYQDATLLVDREAIMRATTPQVITLDEVSIGVDNGNIKHYVMMTARGVFRYGETRSWEEIEGFLTQYPNSKMVIDSNPFPDMPSKLAKKYPGRVWAHWYVEDKKNVATINWLEGDRFGGVESDRTKIFDQVAREIVRKDLVFVMRKMEMETYISHWTPMYRTITVNARQQKRGVWLTQENKPDHLAHATIYARIGLYKASSGFAGGLLPQGAGVLSSPEWEAMTVPGVQSTMTEDGRPAVVPMLNPEDEAEEALVNPSWGS